MTLKRIKPVFVIWILVVYYLSVARKKAWQSLCRYDIINSEHKNMFCSKQISDRTKRCPRRRLRIKIILFMAFIFKERSKQPKVLVLKNKALLKGLTHILGQCILIFQYKLHIMNTVCIWVCIYLNFLFIFNNSRSFDTFRINTRVTCIR